MCSCQWNIHKPHEMESRVSLGSLAQQTFPHAGTPETTVWAPSSVRGKHQGVKSSSSSAAAVSDLCHKHQPALPRFSSLKQTPGVLCGSVPSPAAWVKRSLCRTPCAPPGHRCCLPRLLCGRHCVSVAVFGRLVGGRSPRLMAPTVVLQAPG